MRKLKKMERQVVDSILQPAQKKKKSNKLISTGSTLLDLAISGGISEVGGIPGGNIIEIFGPESVGKTAVLAEIAASIQSNGGDAKFMDAEARLNKRYASIFGVNLNNKNYSRPDTVTDMFTDIRNWNPQTKSSNAINGIMADSLASLTTNTEMSDNGDPYGMRRAKEFSEGLRKVCRLIAKNNWIIACSNQERQGPSGITTPGGRGIPYYSSIRIRLSKMYARGKSWQIKKEKTIGNKKIIKIIGIATMAEVKKSSVDDPFRQAPIYIMFGYGIDDIRGNLQWYKDVTGGKKYNCVDANWSTMDKAINHIETNNLEKELKKMTIKKWHEIETQFNPYITNRKKKAR